MIVPGIFTKKYIFAAIAIVVVGLVCSLYLVIRNTPANTAVPSNLPAAAKEDTPKPGSLELIVLSQPVFITMPEATQEAEITEAIEITAGTVVSTGDTGRAELRYPNKSVTRLNYNTKLQVKQIDEEPQNSLLLLIQGSIWNRVAKLLGKESFSTDTGSMIATVRGTAYRMGILDDGTNVLMVKEGEVGVEAANEAFEMKENTRMTFQPATDEKPTTEEFNVEDEADDWSLFNIEQDEQWMEQNKDAFADDVLGESTENTEDNASGEEGSGLALNTIPTPELIDCTGPDGVQFRASRQDCDNLNSFWNSVNPPKNTSSNSTSNSSSSSEPTAAPTTAPTALPTETPTPSPTPTPVDQNPNDDLPTDFEIFVVCVKLNTDGTYTAYFDYILHKRTPVFLFISKIEGGEGNPPSILTPNNNELLIEAQGLQSSPITWIADNFSATATVDSPQCQAVQ